ncbi:hypothetical protein NJB14197_26970 [Mycobacterium montefiorense]|uniref:Carrier domain-containing protein n=1 Tax=Mycobacterium montefiorense TaxID=154654 RepID=A0AA37PNZ7_9MYCO|nr:hypothetical protein MmonteBS_22380 [Mycobacterium montefiorense]GKU35004.1 hypothetical protein NJB14191_23500 [Mycobacterium montefiorense]GKU41015.1 hypothetical protein NJB14192_30010 [Mycobacterium montefiorense]GKU47126.1 hypothetical protein NJB14194_37440 [Mycobacterium montefiorense]GKU49246.1 hypothetical protein NJB14195_04930 [Mycobacterium montefiorense]
MLDDRTWMSVGGLSVNVPGRLAVPPVVDDSSIGETVRLTMHVPQTEDVLDLIKLSLEAVSENEIPQLTTDLEIDDLGLSSVQMLELLAYIEESARRQ